jgi:SAM-dependent methyltransferase
MSRTNDRALRFYNEVLGLERLHYGLFQPDDELSFENFKRAQERYDDYLVERIPDGVNSILDVGCGTGILVKKLIDLSYQAEGLSPDINHKEIFKKDISAPFHHTTFEDFVLADRFDCIIMGESCQYIDLAKVFENSKRSLRNSGYLMICDYFVLDSAPEELRKSGHNYRAFMQQAQRSGFSVVSDQDITDRVTKTLDLASDFIRRGSIALNIATEKARHKHPHLEKILLWLFRNKIRKTTKQIELLDSEKFRTHKTYRFILLKDTIQQP